MARHAGGCWPSSISPAEHQAEIAFELAAGAFHEGRMDTLRRWAEPAMRAAAEAGDPALLAGAEALAALGASWDGDRETADRRLDRASARLRRLDDAALGRRVRRS